MPYRNKTYVAFDGDSDLRSYNMLKMWRDNDKIDFDFFDAHDINDIDPSDSEYSKKRKLKARLRNAKAFVLLVGGRTRYQIKYVRWEIEAALELGIPIVVVNLNGDREFDDELCPKILHDQLAIHVAFKAKIIKYALGHWPYSHANHSADGTEEPRWYKDSVYQKLGLNTATERLYI